MMLVNDLLNSESKSIPKRSIYTIKARAHSLQLGQKTLLMGVINLTPDSFSRDGLLKNERYNIDLALDQAGKMITAGADILDVGGESSRPGAQSINDDMECERIIPVIKQLAKYSAIPISVDTYKPLVANEALLAGASIVNNIQGINLDARLLDHVKEYEAGLILMHMKGTPRTMQENIHYDEYFMDEIKNTLRKSIEKCLNSGIKSDKIIIDPGIGFGKTPGHNLTLINRLEEFQELNHPILVGPSRKSFIGKILNHDVDQRLYGTLGSMCAAVMRGAHIVRAHDIKAVKEAVSIVDAIMNETIN